MYPLLNKAQEEFSTGAGEFFLSVQKIEETLTGNGESYGDELHPDSQETLPNTQTKNPEKSKVHRKKKGLKTEPVEMSVKEAILVLWCLFGQTKDSLSKVFKISPENVQQLIGEAVMEGDEPEKIRNRILSRLKGLSRV